VVRLLFEISPKDARPIYVQIMDEIRRAIVLGTLRAEEPLPSVRQMASELRVNPNTVQQAYRELEREGAVHVRRGQGTFVTGGTAGSTERRSLLEGVVERALRDAYRHGITAADLIDALRRAAASEEHAMTGEGR
jgi:GntR family transcriptional regulator